MTPGVSIEVTVSHWKGKSDNIQAIVHVPQFKHPINASVRLNTLEHSANVCKMFSTPDIFPLFPILILLSLIYRLISTAYNNLIKI